MLFKAIHAILEWIIRDIPGGIGQRIRASYWKTRFSGCGKNLRIDEGVIFHNPARIEMGDDVWIMAYAVITGPSPCQSRVSPNKTVYGQPADKLIIGSEVQVGLFCILNGVGGLVIGDCVTFSARSSVYSATHLPRCPDDPELLVGANGMVRRRPVFSQQRQVTIGEGAWLGLGSSVICCNIGKDGFVKSGVVVTKDLGVEMEIDSLGAIQHRYSARKGT